MASQTLLKKSASKKESDDTLSLIFLLILGAILPLVLLFFEKSIWSWPVIVEELGKGLVVYFFILPLFGDNRRLLLGFYFGMIFGISENIFYFLNFFNTGQLDLFLARFLWPLPMHFTSVLLMVMAGLKNRRYFIFGLVAAMLLHYIYNTYLTNLIFNSVFLKGLLKGINF